jgi:glycosyltransferase involved in cell wall biosynthesis
MAQVSAVASTAAAAGHDRAPRRVLWLAKGLGLGGAERLLVDMVGHVDPSRYEVEVAYVLPWKDALVPDLEAQGVPVWCLGGGRTADMRWAPRLRRLVAARRIDLVHTHAPVPGIVARVMCAGTGVPLVHTEHNMWSRYKWPTRWGNAATFGRNRAAIAVSSGVSDSITPLPGARHTPVRVIRHGTDVRNIRRGAAHRAEARRRLGFADGVPLVGSVGNFTPKKDQQMLVAAFALARRTVPDAHLVLVGSGPLEEALRQKVAQAGQTEHVHFLGSRSDVLQLLPAFDVFALSSRFEGLPIALVEAMATGVACVATAVGGIPEIVDAGRNGLLVPPGRPDEMAGALVTLLVDHDERSRLAASATDIGSALDLREAVRHTENLYAEVLGQ